MRRNLRQIEHDAGGIDCVRIGLRRVFRPVREVAVGEALNALRSPAAPSPS